MDFQAVDAPARGSQEGAETVEFPWKSALLPPLSPVKNSRREALAKGSKEDAKASMGQTVS